MSYDPTQWASQPPEQQPSQGQPPAGAPSYGQPPATPPAYNQSNPNWAPTQQATPAPQAYGQSNPSLPPYGQPSQPPAPPAYGQSNPSLPPYGQPQQTPSDPGAYNQYAPQPPADPYAPPPPPTDPYAPSAYQPGIPPAYPPAAQPQKKSSLKTIVIVVIVILLIVAGGGGTAIYFATRPQPVISVTSKYAASALPAGSSSTSFTVTGKDFSGNSAITFLLDNAPAPGASTAQSDNNGNVTATLTVTDAWGAGNHSLTAKDANGYLTKVSKQITVVAQGQAGTPGPNGAPTDSASGTISVTIQANSDTETTTLTITGSESGGKVCGTHADGQPHSDTGTANGLSYTETIVRTCDGTYKSGKIDYTETTTTDKITFSNGVVCNLNAPYVDGHLTGTFSSSTSVSGSFSSEQANLTCALDGQSQSSNVAAESGTWTGVASM